MTSPQGAPREAGREMDRRIAEQVMGFTIYHYDKDYEARCYYSLCDADGDSVAPDYKAGRMYGERKTEAEAWADCPHYSTDIAAAHTILDKLMESHFMVSVACSHENGWWCVVYPPSGPCIESDYAISAPLAICLAALAALTPHPTPKDPQ